MSIWRIAWGYLWNRKLPTILTILSVALAVGLISSVLTLREETSRRFEEEGQAFDLVVGGKGSPLQLVLSSVYFMDTPNPNVPIALWDKFRQDTDYVEAAYPISLGDSYASYRIVGTVPELFDHKWVNTYGVERTPFALAEGERFAAPLEAVLGALVAQQTGLQVGDTFVSTHGLIQTPEGMEGLIEDHADHPYKVVGILEPSSSPFDRAIYTSLESVWHAHEHTNESASGEETDPHTEVTAFLIQLLSPALRWQYLEDVRDTTSAVAAIPIDEVQQLYTQLLDTAKTILLAIGYLVVVISAITIMIGLYLSIQQRRRDLAIMRALGASAGEIFGSVLIEALIVTLLGILAGWCLGTLVTFGMSQYLEQRFGLVISSIALPPDAATAFATVALVGIFAGILPAWQAYDSDVAKDLAER